MAIIYIEKCDKNRKWQEKLVISVYKFCSFMKDNYTKEEILSRAKYIDKALSLTKKEFKELHEPANYFLDERTTEFLKLYYKDNLTYKNIGDMYHLNGSRVGQIIHKGYFCLYHIIKCLKFNDNLEEERRKKDAESCTISN